MLELLGRFFIQRTAAFFFFSFAPFFFVFLFLFYQFSSLREKEDLFHQSERQSQIALEKRKCKESFLSHYAQTEPYFLSQHLESLPLLLEERNNLVNKLKHPACSQKGVLQKKLKKWEKQNNRIIFAEAAFRSSKRTKETEQRLLHPVEIGLTDLERILATIEEIPIGSFHPFPNAPQLIITDFSLSKKEDLYELDFSLLKREFIRD